MTLIEMFHHNAVFFYGVVGFISLMVGSFLNVVIHRLPIMMENEWRRGCQELDCEDPESLPPPEVFNLNSPGSHCPGCDKPIRWWQNVPLLSYLLLGGKCASCKIKISIRYPLVELVTALLSLVVAWKFGPTLPTIAGIVITWCLVALTMIDFDHQLLPDSITLPLMWLGLLASLIPVFVTPVDAIVGAAAGYLSLWAVYQIFRLITGKEGMGYGDFKLLAALGAWFGWQMLPIIILLSSLVGAVVGISLILFKGQGREVPIPFGPYLAAAGWIAMLGGATLAGIFGPAFG